ncbi:MAG: 50S ribosomal protein L29 [Deltaproteobacteria bacterium]|nr:50S ribosomal protein L29 [Deltaproteobacteria bacterium]
MKKNEINEMSAEQLQRKVGELSEELFNLRLQKSISQLQNTAKLGKTRRDRARVLTRISQLQAAD